MINLNIELLNDGFVLLTINPIIEEKYIKQIFSHMNTSMKFIVDVNNKFSDFCPLSKNEIEEIRLFLIPNKKINVKTNHVEGYCANTFFA